MKARPRASWCGRSWNSAASDVIARNDILRGDEPPADAVLDASLNGFDKKVNIGCYRGICAWFGCRVGGVVRRGSRLDIQSSVGMYCIGEK